MNRKVIGKLSLKWPDVKYPPRAPLVRRLDALVLELNVWMNGQEHFLDVHAVVGVDISVNECSHLRGTHLLPPGIAA